LAKQLKYITIFVVLALLQLTKVGATMPSYNLDSLNFLLQKNLKPKEKVDVLLKIASIYNEEGNPAAQKYVLEAHELSKKLKYDKGLGQTYFMLAQSKEGKASFDSLDFLYKEAISAFSKAGLEDKEAYARNSLGIVYERVGRYKKALELYYSSLIIFRRLEDKKGIANEINNIGLIYQLQKQYKNAIKFFEEAMKLGQELRNETILANAFNNLAICYQEQKNMELARTYFLKVLAIDIKQGEPDNISSSYNNLGVVESENGQLEKAKTFFQKAIFIKEANGKVSGLGNTYGNMATVYRKQKIYDSAFYFLNKAYLAAKKESANETLVEVYLEYSLLAEAKKNYPEAVSWMKKYAALKDSLSIAESAVQLKAFEENFEQLIQTKELDQTNSEKERKYLRYGLFILIAISVLAALVSMIFHTRKIKAINKTLQQNQKKIEVQNKILQVKNIEVMQAKEAAEEAANLKTQFISTISHEIRTPLNAIIGVTNLLHQSNPSQEQLENLNILKISSDNLLGLVNNILDFSKLESGKIQLENIEFNLKALVQDVRDLFSVKAAEKNIQLLIAFDDKIPNVLKGDPLRINQLLINLVGNAIKFTESGYVKMEVSLQLSTINHALVYFSVADTGIGIHQNKQKQIFDSFTQADANTTRKYGGTGLGLSICKRILETLHSRLQLESTIGVGSTFYFTINFEVSRNASFGKSAKTASFEDSIEGKRILIVEDNMMNIMVLRQFLERWGVKAEIAMNGREAIDRMKEAHFDAVLMDIHMPEMDGIEATIEIRKLPEERKRNVPIIALTAENEMQFRQRVYEVGMNDYIFKPFNPEDLKERLGYALYNSHINKYRAPQS